MAASLHFLVLAVLLLSLAPFSSAMLNCTVDGDCSSGRGHCVGSYCACESGFGGDHCQDLPASSCLPFANVSQSTSGFRATASISYNHPSLTISITAPLEKNSFIDPTNSTAVAHTDISPVALQTIVLFGDGSHTECNYPNSNTASIVWTDSAAADGECSDKLTAVLAWTDARSKCGFVDVYGNRTFQQTVYIIRTYYLGTIRGSPIYRNETVAHVLSVMFPSEVDVFTSQVQVTGAPGILSALTGVTFDPSSNPEKWTVTFQTSIQAPFKLINPRVMTVDGDLQDHQRYENKSESLNNLSSCSNNTFDCLQETSVNFVQGLAGDACDALAGTITLEFDITCSEGLNDNCPIQTTQTATVTVTLETGDSCPVTDIIKFSVTKLSLFGDAVGAHTQTSFLTSSKMYLGADIESATAEILSKTVKQDSVCVSLASDTSFLHCVPVNYTVETPHPPLDPIFSIAFSANAGVFAQLDGEVSSAQSFVVKATIQVSFSETSKKRGAAVIKSSSMSLKTPAFLLTHDTIIDGSAGSNEVTSSASTNFLMLNLSVVLFAVICIIL